MSGKNYEELPMKSFLELKDMTFLIPFQQREYKWTKSNVLKARIL